MFIFTHIDIYKDVKENFTPHNMLSLYMIHVDVFYSISVFQNTFGDLVN